MIDNLNSSNMAYIEELYQLWQENPQQVPSQWVSYFENFSKVSSKDTRAVYSSGVSSAAVSQSVEEDHKPISMTYKQSRVDSLIWAYRDIGYIFADLNPLGNYRTPEMEYMYITMRGNFQNLELSEYDLSEEDLDKEFHTGRTFDPPRATLREILIKLQKIYASHMGVEILHIQNKVMRQWLIRNIEGLDRKWPNEAKISVQNNLIKANEFEHFIHSNFIGQKRFSLEGAEVLVPALQYLFRSAPQHNIQEIVMGMTHRGRLNILINAIGKPASEIFSTFLHNYKPHNYGGSGDVRYHLGQSFDYIDKQNTGSLHITLVSNPSHLESTDPVVEGKARGVQLRRGDINRKKVLPVLIHGDAAFSGQGVVAETFNLSQLKGYRTGGTIHIIINNQIGFTTASRDARSTYFATDIAKTIQVPIFHVNGDDPEAVIQAIDLALRWRQKFGYDAVVDIFCYRKLGHNETDEPSFTHPIMYSLIKNHLSVTELYGKNLGQEGIYSEGEQNRYKKKYVAALKRELEKAKKSDGFAVNDSFKRGVWKDFTSKYSFSVPKTGVEKEKLKRVLNALTTVPEGFELHPKLQRFVNERRESFTTGKSIDWSLAEALSFGSLLLDGYSIRLSGEDSSRGTFSQRHAQWWDVKSSKPKPYVPLNHIGEKQGFFSVFDSPLSEYSVLGFEYGYSISQPNTLVLFEAQFGDFVNGAQVIIDQYITAGESKWFRASNIVMLLPHGYEGQGPEHSSAYLERFLQLCAKDNLQVCNLTTPAQYFHLLRKQMKQKYRKPLIIMSPKSLLRHKMAVSTADELIKGQFEFVFHEPTNVTNSAEILIFCSGKIYYDLIDARNKKGSKNTSIIRIEQLYPFPQKMLEKIFQEAGKTKRVIWVQEEPRNRGAWGYIREKIRLISGQNVEYAGREPSPSSATGSYIKHDEELKEILRRAIPDG